MLTFTHAGVSKLAGKVKVRFANGAERVAVLIKNQHTDIDMIQLKWPMTKPQAVEYLMHIDFADGNTAVQTAIDKAAKKYKVKPVVPVELETA